MTRHSSTGRWLGPTLLGSAAALAASALYAASKTREAERQTPPIGQFLTVDGVRLHYVERGRGEPLVLIHGNGMMIQDFLVSGIVDDLAKRYRVIIIDRPGYGYSDRPRGLWTPRAHATLFQKALQQLGVSQAVVLGHSWGALVAVALALQAPQLVRSLVLASGYYYPTLRADVMLSSPAAIPGIGDLMRHTVSPVVGRILQPAMIKAMFAPAAVTERFDRQFPKAMMLRPDAAAGLSGGRRAHDAGDCRASEALPRPEAPGGDHRGRGRSDRRRRPAVEAPAQRAAQQ